MTEITMRRAEQWYARIAPLQALGWSSAKIAEHLDSGDSYIRHIAARVGHAFERPTTPWTPERDAYLGKRWGSASAGKIACDLGVTKNSVIGRIWRLGLSRPQAAPAPRLTDDDFRGCRWIAGESRPLRPGMFCGAPVVGPEHAWCETHRAIAYRVVRASEAAGWTAERRAKQAAVARMIATSGHQ